MAPQIVWLRRDLRLADQPAFHAAAAAGPVLPVFVLDDERPGKWRWGGAARWWLHHSLAALAADLAGQGLKLVLRRGDAVRELAALAAETGAGAIHALHHHEPWWPLAEAELAEALPAHCPLHLHHGQFLCEPGSVRNLSGGPYKIYTPFSRAVLERMPPAPPLPVPRLTAPESWPESLALGNLALLPTKPDWAGGLRAEWTPGEAGAAQRLAAFLPHAEAYERHRNLPSLEGTARLSPHLAFGEISPRTIWHAMLGQHGTGPDTFRKELIWRDYATNVIVQDPTYAVRSHNPAVARIAWRDPRSDAAALADLQAWRAGRTGYPVVDAGMRQLWHSGWMHNRVRMIAASFLIKHLLIDWRIGERWFWDTLVDADFASNAANWQWVAGSGVDANMFVRIMAPLSQSEKFDAGGYIRHWVPDLAGLPDGLVHDPVRTPPGYPAKLIGHREARDRALAAWAAAKG